MSEAQVAAAVMGFLAGTGWDCWPEVVLPEGRADIVAVRPFPFMPHRKCVHIVETKMTFSLDLLEQAISRRQYAHYVTIAAPTNPGTFYKRLCRDFGIGLLRVPRRVGLDGHVFELWNWETSIVEARRHAHRWAKGSRRYYGPEETLNSLHDDQKRFAPGGTSSSGHSTAWSRTMDRAAAFVREHPGCGVKDIVKKSAHHYATSGGARQGFLVWLEKRSDVVVRREGKSIRFYPADSAPPVTNLL